MPPEEQIVNTEENQQTTPDLDQIMTDGRASFTDGAVAPESDPAIAGPAVVKEEDLLSGSPEDDINPPAAIPPQEAQLPATPQEPARFKSHEEAEKGYRHLQREKTLADQRVLTLTEELQRQKKQEQEQQVQAEEEQAFTVFAQSRNEQALKEIDEIDPDDPEFRKKAAAAWGRAHRDIRYYKGKPAAPPLPASTERQQAAPAPQEAEAAAQTRAYVQEKIAAAGIPADDLLFWQIARDAPATNEQGQPLGIDDQIQWALTATKNYRDQLLGTQQGANQAAIEADRKARETQAREMPLGRSAADRAAAPRTATEPVSMADAISFAQEQRRL